VRDFFATEGETSRSVTEEHARQRWRVHIEKPALALTFVRTRIAADLLGALNHLQGNRVVHRTSRPATSFVGTDEGIRLLALTSLALA